MVFRVFFRQNLLDGRRSSERRQQVAQDLIDAVAHYKHTTKPLWLLNSGRRNGISSSSTLSISISSAFVMTMASYPDFHTRRKISNEVPHKTAFGFKRLANDNLKQAFYLHLRSDGILEFGPDDDREVGLSFPCEV